MGQVQQHQKYLNNWSKVGSEDSRIFNCEVDIYSDGNMEAITVQRVFQSEMHFMTELRRLDGYKQLCNIPGMVRLLDVERIEESNLCSNLYKIIATYEYGHQLGQINITDFLQQVIHTLIELQSRDIYHEDLRPQSFIQQQTIKVYLPPVSQYTRFLSGLEQHCYLCPELFQQLGRRVYKPIYNKEKSDVFTLGLVCLEIILQQSIQDIYNYEEYIVNQIVLDSHLRNANISLISWMLRDKAEDRPTFIQVYEATIVSMVEPQQPQHTQSSSHKQSMEIAPPLQYIPIQQSPNNRYTQRSQNSISRRPSSQVPHEYGFLHEQSMHVPFNPGSDYLDSSRVVSNDHDIKQSTTPLEFVSPPKKVTTTTNTTTTTTSIKNQRPTSILKDVSIRSQNVVQQAPTTKRPALLKSRPLRSKSPIPKRKKK